MLGFQLLSAPGPSACNEASPPRDPQARDWASSGGNGPLGAIHNPTRARSAALLCQVLKERFLKVQRQYVAQPHRGSLLLQPDALRADADSSPIVEEFPEACVAFRGKTKDGLLFKYAL
ncbi:hypothetical protein CesoFtcFv8_006956 [Champsocephalus esox]|nr:hypothetical protein CesoFtcFv8_006956 [Champsocephalus esox]